MPKICQIIRWHSSLGDDILRHGIGGEFVLETTDVGLVRGSPVRYNPKGCDRCFDHFFHRWVDGEIECPRLRLILRLTIEPSLGITAQRSALPKNSWMASPFRIVTKTMSGLGKGSISG